MRVLASLALAALTAALTTACANEPVPAADGVSLPPPGPPADGPTVRHPGARPDPGREAACAPGDVSGFAAPGWEAPRPATNACSAAQIDGYFSDCLDPATALPVRCAQHVANHAACAACLSPEPSAAGPGPLLEHPGGVRVNVAGCIALAQDDLRPEGCGAREATAAACAATACADCDEGEGEACERDARQGACASWQMRTCSELSVAAGCVAGADAADRFRRVARVFCGS
ncbi:MAG: hypothetical protein WKG00_25770 [Polyangiaceae bacterium]